MSSDRQEKVRKVKSAKEKLHQVQDLAVIAQQSPGSAMDVVGHSGDLVATTEGSVLSHAPRTSKPGVSVNKGESPSGSMRKLQRNDGMDEHVKPRTQLERMREEREIFVKILNRLDILQNKKPETQGGEEQQRVEGRSHDVKKPGLNQTSTAAVVTFASHDELYDKIRSQRILHEQLQSQKRKLEDIIDRSGNKRQYSQNQDVHSDTASMSTDVVSFPASADATMATWGGSTMDNLESVEDGQERCDDDGVEEDEKENDVKIPSRQIGSISSRISSQLQLTSRLEQQDSRQFLKQQQQEDKHLKGLVREWLRVIDGKMTSLTKEVDKLLNKPKTEGRQFSDSLSKENSLSASGGLWHPMSEQILQLQNQSMMLICHQLVQALARQQGDIQHLQQQIQHLQLQAQAHSRQQNTSVCTAAGMLLNSPHTVITASQNLQPTAPVVSLASMSSHQQMHSSSSQANLSNMAVLGLFGNPGCQRLQRDISEHSFPWDASRRPADGASGRLGADPVDSSGSACLPQQAIPTTVSNLRSKSSLDQQHQAFNNKSSVLAMNQDIGYLLHPTSPPFDSPCESRKKQSSAGTRSSKTNKDNNIAARGSSCSLVSSRNKKRSFNLLRETIYAEAASLISQNESRPYFLLELFRDVRQIDSDQMRRQTLKSIHELLQSGSKINMATNPVDLQEEITTAVRTQLERQTGTGTMQDASFDYAELVHSYSSLSTPPNGGQGSPACQLPQTNIKQLDDHLKDIMMSVVPVVKEHIHVVCSVQFLDHINQLVISLTNQIGDQEFLWLFRHQLATILGRTLLKYKGKKMKECGEELLVDIFDVLYNELAYYKLMQNMGTGNIWPAMEQVAGGTDAGVLPEEAGGYDDDESQQQYKTELTPTDSSLCTRTCDKDTDGRDKEGNMVDHSQQTVIQDSTLDSSGLSHLKALPTAYPENEDNQEDGSEKLMQEIVPSHRQVMISFGERCDEASENMPLMAADASHLKQPLHEPLNGEDNRLEEQIIIGESERLPALLDSTVDSSTPEHRSKYEEEQRSLNGLDAILASLGGMEELAGDEASVLDPDLFMF